MPHRNYGKGAGRSPRADRVHGGTTNRVPPDMGVRSALLHCHHSNDFSKPWPVIGDMVWCSSCREYSRVILVSTVYSARCRDCVYSRSFGRAHFAANQGAREHSQKKGHTVDLRDGGKVEHTYEASGGTLLLIDPDAPPF